MLLGPLFTGGSALRRVTTRGQLCVEEQSLHISVAPPLCLTEQHFPQYSLEPQGPFTSEGEGSREPVSSCPPHSVFSQGSSWVGTLLGKTGPTAEGIENTGLGQQSGSCVACTGDPPDPPRACPPWPPVSSRPWLQTAASSPSSSAVSLRVNVGSPLRACACGGCPCWAWFTCCFEKAISKQS